MHQELPRSSEPRRQGDIQRDGGGGHRQIRHDWMKGKRGAWQEKEKILKV